MFFFYRDHKPQTLLANKINLFLKPQIANFEVCELKMTWNSANKDESFLFFSLYKERQGVKVLGFFRRFNCKEKNPWPIPSTR